jgi:hypothetical protein
MVTAPGQFPRRCALFCFDVKPYVQFVPLTTKLIRNKLSVSVVICLYLLSSHVSTLVHRISTFYIAYITFYYCTIREMSRPTRNVNQTQVKLANNNRHAQRICCLFCIVSIVFPCAVRRLAEDLSFVPP